MYMSRTKTGRSEVGRSEQRGGEYFLSMLIIRFLCHALPNEECMEEVSRGDTEARVFLFNTYRLFLFLRLIYRRKLRGSQQRNRTYPKP